MGDSFSTADAYIREALAILRQDEQERVAAFEREVAQLRQKIRALEELLSPTNDEARRDDSDSRRLPEVGHSSDQWDRRMLNATSGQRWAKMLDGLTHMDALLLLAEQNEGVVRPAEAKRIFVEAKKVKGNPKNTLSHLYHLLRESDQFEKIAPGTYRLRSKPDQVQEDQDQKDSERAEFNIQSFLAVHPNWSSDQD
jgi:hypothetical protein